MKRVLLAAGLAAMLTATAGCADTGGYRGGVAVGYDGFYDDFYGPFYDGYWRRDGHFYYRPGPRRPFVRDDAGHFHREAFAGGHPVHGMPHRGGIFHRGPRPQ